MERTTVYLPTDVKAALRQAARVRGISEAEIIRQAVAQAVSQSAPVAPRAGLFSSTELTAARDEELLQGFGDR